MRHRKWFLFGFSAVAVFTALSSVAFACTWIQGVMTATGAGGTTSQAIGSGGGENGFLGMTFCGGYSFDDRPGNIGNNAGSPTGSASVGPSGIIHLQLTPYAGNPISTDPYCQKPSQLPDTGALKGPGSAPYYPFPGIDNPSCATPPGCSGEPSVYTVTWSQGPGLGDCMNTSTNQAAKPTVTSSGSVTATAGGQTAQKAINVATGSPEFRITNGSGSGDYFIGSQTPGSGGVCVSDIGGGRGSQVNITVL